MDMELTPFYDALLLTERVDFGDNCVYNECSHEDYLEKNISCNLAPYGKNNLKVLTGSNEVPNKFFGQIMLLSARPPDWINDIIELIIAPLTAPRQALYSQVEHLTRKIRMPFADWLAPAALLAHQKLIEMLKTTKLPASEALYEDLFVDLLYRLNQISAKTVYCEFLEKSRRNNCKSNQEMFTDFLRNGGAIEIVKKYPVLARQLAFAIKSWLSAMNTFFLVNFKNWSQITGYFGISSCELVKQIVFGLSDEHHPGLTVAKIEFMCGTSIYFKPRCGRTDMLFRQILSAIEIPYDIIRKLSPPSIEIGEFTWMRQAQCMPPSSAKEREEFFSQIGVILGVAHVLSGTDLHYENIVNNFGLPALIDAETLIHPNRMHMFNNNMKQNSFHEIERFLESSVLSVGLLPNQHLRQTNATFDSSALNGLNRQVTPNNIVRWKEHLDGHWELMYGREEVTTNFGIPSGPLSQQEKTCILDSFTQSAKVLADKSVEIINIIGYHLETNFRVIVRPTAFYARFLDALTHPKYLKSGALWSLQVARLCRIPASDAESITFHQLVRSEHDALFMRCIPYYTTTLTSVDIKSHSSFTSPAFIKGALQKSQYSSLQHTIKNNDLDVQRTIIRGTLGISNKAHWPYEKDDSLLEHALRLGAYLEKQQVRGCDHSSAWITTSPSSTGQSVSFSLPDEGLYSGLAGICLGLGACYHIENSKNILCTINSAWKSVGYLVERKLSEIDFTWYRGGISKGIEVVGYIGAVLTQLTGSDIFYVQAKSWVSKLKKYTLGETNWKGCDILTGHAGSLLCLLSMHEFEQDQQFLDIAEDRLLKIIKNVQHAESGSCWHCAQSESNEGFSHGNAGIAYALARSTKQFSSIRQVYSLLQDALRHENASVCEKTGGWRERNNISGMIEDQGQWCHGAVGIGLSRAGILAVKSLPNSIQAQVVSDITRAKNAVSSMPDLPSDYLCCGNMGRLLFLDELPKLFGHSISTNELLSDKVRSNEGRWSLKPATDCGIVPLGFFQGIAGIIYSICKISQPDVFPNIATIQALNPMVQSQ